MLSDKNYSRKKECFFYRTDNESDKIDETSAKLHLNIKIMRVIH